MPIHDWTRVTPGTWHDFHLSWVVQFSNSLNRELLPEDFYAQIEPVESNEFEPTAIIGEAPHSKEQAWTDSDFELQVYTRKRRAITIRHTSNDRVVALLELVSPGNKSSQQAINSFVEKAHESVLRGYHLLIVDLFPPGPRDPNGIHALIWSEMGGGPFTQPPDEPLTLVAYAAGHPNTAYIEPTAVGRALIDMPLFLTPERYVNVPLEATYAAAFQGVPRKWKAVLVGTPTS